ncbi:MAG: sugar transferase [Bacteroidetes bacterium]|nr:MAG: sugar transferase [Bacteroidota bacterium]
MSQTITAEHLIKTEEIVVVGVAFPPSKSLAQAPNPAWHLKRYDNSFAAYRRLLQYAKKPDEQWQPRAIICDFTLLNEEKFLFFKNIRKHSGLAKIPIILINREKEDRRPEALRAGADDCYNVPVDWEALFERIEFLCEFKTAVTPAESDSEPQDFEFKMPRSKRAFDIFFAASCILVFLPVLLLVALAVKLTSRGPVIYRSKRVGTGYQIFDFLKFRSMYVDADARLAEIQHLNQYAQNGHADKVGGGLFRKFKNDPRVTPVGRFIRKTSLDELPQLFNVLKGDMSIVGNRPLPLYEAEQLTRDAWVQRFRAPAGITGLWQISKRGKDKMSAEERIELDIEYAENFSFWYDLKIILKTPFAMFQAEDV